MKMSILNYHQPTTIEDPTIIIQQFKQATIHAKEAGFDGVERTELSCQFVPLTHDVYLFLV